MGDLNQLSFVRANAEQFHGPFFEIGSKDYGNTPDLRSVFSGEEYLGADMMPGPGVDLILDLTESFDRIDNAVQGKRFGTIFCLSVLEHCERPFVMAENITSLLREGGKLCLSVPFVWRFHGYPSDYWRFTPEGVKKLFPGLRFAPELSCVSTCIPGEIKPLDENVGQRKIPKSLSGNVKALQVFQRLGFFKLPFSWFYGLPPTNINMIGIKTAT